MTGWTVAIVVLLAAAAVLGWLAYRGRVPWSWFAAALAGAAAAFGLRPRRRDVQTWKPASGQPAADTVAPVVREADRAADARREAIRDAEDDPDRLERLERLADVNNGGRE